MIGLETSSSKCGHHSCQEPAISLSDHCWVHTESKIHYHQKLQNFLNALGDEKACLDLRKTELQGIDFSNRNIHGSCFNQARLRVCHFIGVNLSDAEMIGARLDSCDFIGGALVNANFTKGLLTNCSFSYTDLRQSSFVEAFLQNIDFVGAHLCGVSLWNTEFNDVKHLKRKSFLDPEKPPKKGRAYLSEKNFLMACDSYRMLKHYLNHKGFYEDASWAAYRELTMERKYFFESRDWRYFPSLLMDLLSGYAAKPNRVIVSSISLVLLFALAYFFLDAAQPVQSAGTGSLSLMDAAYFSFITFTTVGFGDLVPKDALIYRTLVCFEAFSGPFMIGLYLFALTRRYATN